jgi:hypothetical protein
MLWKKTDFIRPRFRVIGAVTHWVKVKNPNGPAVRREAEEDWGR